MVVTSPSGYAESRFPIGCDGGGGGTQSGLGLYHSSRSEIWPATHGRL